ncbi:16S rRNA (guanine(1207)-N(2))-methyltransferase RsmC [Vibrio injensis]|uniref:16S rRNA (guanine(1207)-N(2))-methyltransferase RsmC n=1 Tax=Vibrio injensis TaxID=1307414 RepID=UPI00278C866C|nr:16S rRNA (guanine(1207)-N(2))-methyltransferase RsmC [Vibrio injensis]
MSHYTAPSQITQRQLTYFTGKKVLVAGEVEDNFPIELSKHCDSVTVFTTHYGYYRQLQASSAVKSHFGAELTAEITADLLLLYWPKAKLEAQFLLAMLLAKLPAHCEVIVVGENRSGIKAVEKLFSPYGVIKKYDSARRCSFYWGQCTQPVAEFDLEDWFKSYTVHYQQHTLTIRSLPGVFSHGEFDLGSQLLLDSLPPLQGKILDFGCGAGVLGCVLSMLNPEIQLEMCDISALAIHSSQATLAANGLTGRVFASDVYSDTDRDYHSIVTNPPFHSGLDTSYRATETLLQQAPNYLTASGQLFVVANNFLKYPPLIEQAFGNCVTLNKTGKFSIYHAQK